MMPNLPSSFSTLFEDFSPSEYFKDGFPAGSCGCNGSVGIMRQWDRTTGAQLACSIRLWRRSLGSKSLVEENHGITIAKREGNVINESIGDDSLVFIDVELLDYDISKSGPFSSVSLNFSSSAVLLLSSTTAVVAEFPSKGSEVTGTIIGYPYNTILKGEWYPGSDCCVCLLALHCSASGQTSNCILNPEYQLKRDDHDVSDKSEVVGLFEMYDVAVSTDNPEVTFRTPTDVLPVSFSFSFQPPPLSISSIPQSRLFDPNADRTAALLEMSDFSVFSDRLNPENVDEGKCHFSRDSKRLFWARCALTVILETGVLVLYSPLLPSQYHASQSFLSDMGCIKKAVMSVLKGKISGMNESESGEPRHHHDKLEDNSEEIQALIGVNISKYEELDVDELQRLADWMSLYSYVSYSSGGINCAVVRRPTLTSTYFPEVQLLSGDYNSHIESLSSSSPGYLGQFELGCVSPLYSDIHVVCVDSLMVICRTTSEWLMDNFRRNEGCEEIRSSSVFIFDVIATGSTIHPAFSRRSIPCIQCVCMDAIPIYTIRSSLFQLGIQHYPTHIVRLPKKCTDNFITFSNSYFLIKAQQSVHSIKLDWLSNPLWLEGSPDFSGNPQDLFRTPTTSVTRLAVLLPGSTLMKPNMCMADSTGFSLFNFPPIDKTNDVPCYCRIVSVVLEGGDIILITHSYPLSTPSSVSQESESCRICELSPVFHVYCISLADPMSSDVGPGNQSVEQLRVNNELGGKTVCETVEGNLVPFILSDYKTEESAELTGAGITSCVKDILNRIKIPREEIKKCFSKPAFLDQVLCVILTQLQSITSTVADLLQQIHTVSTLLNKCNQIAQSRSSMFSSEIITQAITLQVSLKTQQQRIRKISEFQLANYCRIRGLYMKLITNNNPSYHTYDLFSHPIANQLIAIFISRLYNVIQTKGQLSETIPAKPLPADPLSLFDCPPIPLLSTPTSYGLSPGKHRMYALKEQVNRSVESMTRLAELQRKCGEGIWKQRRNYNTEGEDS